MPVVSSPNGSSEFEAKVGSNLNNPLAGQRLTAGGHSYVLDTSLASGDKNSAIYRARSGTRDLVIRIFPNDKIARDELPKLRDVSGAGLTQYIHIGEGVIESPAGTQDSQVWVCVRNYFGETLKDILVEPSQHPDFDCAEVALHLATGIRQLHKLEILHEDIRPSNVVFGRKNPLLTDYGIKRWITTDWQEATFVAPESSPSKKSDMYAFGKVVRLILETFLPADEDERDILGELVERCLDVNPDERPTSDEVVGMLKQMGKRIWNLKELSHLKLACLADYDARLPHSLNVRDIKSAVTRIEESTRKIAADLERQYTFRAALMTPIEMTHLLTSHVFMSGRGAFAGKQETRNYSIISAVDFSLPQPDSGQLDAHQGADFIDAQWEHETKEAARRDVVSLGLGPVEGQHYVEDQLQGMRELSSYILQSDTFVRSDDIAILMNASCPGITAEEVRTLRDLGYLLSVPVEEKNIYPLFQIDSRTGLPFDCIYEVSLSIRQQGHDRSEWSAAAWWFLPLQRLLVLGEGSESYLSPVEWLRSGRSEKTLLG